MKQDNHEVNNGRYLPPCSLFCCYATDNSDVVQYLERVIGHVCHFFLNTNERSINILGKSEGERYG